MSRPPSPNLNFAQYTSPYSRPESPDDAYLQPASASRTSLSSQSQQEPESPTMGFMPWNVMDALMAEDMERLRARRRINSHNRQHGHSHHRDGFGGGASPSGSTFSMDSSIILGLGTGVGLRDVLPLKSRFYDWCCEYFKEPQMRVSVSPHDSTRLLTIWPSPSNRRQTSPAACSTTTRFGGSSGTSR